MIFKPLLIHKIAAGQKTRSACSGGRMRGTKMPPRDVESPGADTRGRASHVQAKIRQRAGGKRVTRAYQAYLQSAEWKARRQATLTRDGHRCTACRSTERLEAHHLTYERVGFERPGDLVTLCHLCHMLEARALTDRRWAGWPHGHAVDPVGPRARGLGPVGGRRGIRRASRGAEGADVRDISAWGFDGRAQQAARSLLALRQSLSPTGDPRAL